MAASTGEQASLDRRRRAAQDQSRAGNWRVAAATNAHLWDDSREPEDGAAYLRCLRRLGCHTEALSLADELSRMFPDSPCCLRQVQRTWLQGRFLRHDPDCALEKLADCTQALRDPLLQWAMPLVALAVMEEAVRARRWDMVKAWAAESDPALLRKALRPGRDGAMSPQASWYDCMLKMLLETGRAAEALDLLYRMPEVPASERDQFLQHRLSAYLMLDSPHDALAVYAELSHRDRPPRRVFVEAARLLSDLGDIRAAIVLLCRALLWGRDPGQTGLIMIELSDLMIRIGWTGIALKQLRAVLKEFRDRGWTVPYRFHALHAAAEVGCGEAGRSYSHRPEALRECLEVWSREASRHIELRRDVDHTRRVRHGFHGTLQVQSDEWAVRMANGSVVACALADTPEQVEPGREVIFDAAPSFYRPLGAETWRAVNVRLAP